MRKFIWQTLILALGIIALAIGIWTMLQTPTMILSPWSLVLIFLPFVLLVSVSLGIVIKGILNSGVHIVYFTSIVLTIICLTFYVTEYRPKYTVHIPNDYVGEVRLFLSSSEENKFEVNEFGIGYLNERTFQRDLDQPFLKITKTLQNL